MADVSSPSKFVSIGERDFVLLIIALYRDCPELWKVKSKDYLNKSKRSLAMERILSVLIQYKPDYTVEKLKKKINILRTNFNKEFQKRSSTSGEDSSEPSLWYYNHLLFIKDQGDTPEPDISQHSLTEGPIAAIQTLSLPPKKKQSGGEDLAPLAPAYFKGTESEADILAKAWAIQTLSLPPKKKQSGGEDLAPLAPAYFKGTESEADILAKAWAIKLSRLAPDQRLFAEKIINDTLFEAEMGTLTRKGARFET